MGLEGLISLSLLPLISYLGNAWKLGHPLLLAHTIRLPILCFQYLICILIKLSVRENRPCVKSFDGILYTQ